MDESLSDFQEKKKSCTGPKNCNKTAGGQVKRKRGSKRVKGQKDIRTALKSKKNELIAYSNDFDKVCKQAGIDVDSEQLQLAIALSKSLQNPDNKCSANSSQRSSFLNPQERTGRIRTTLQEYGFKVPEIKIATINKKLKKPKRHYKLLLSTEAEKQQIISDKYSQILFNNLHDSKLSYTNHLDSTRIHLYHLATNISYESLKENNIFYVDNLLDEINNPSNLGCLLKSWANIPGRPTSPIIETSECNFRELHCSENEVNILLSGSMKCAQDIIKTNQISTQGKQMLDLIKTNMDANLIEIIDCDVEDKVNKPDNVKDKVIPTVNNEQSIINDSVEVIDNECLLKLVVPQLVRSYSPDIFDEEVSCIMDCSKSETKTASQKVSVKNNVNKTNDFMDLTKCVNMNSQGLSTLENKPKSQLSQTANTTKRKSNDLMELTNCIAGTSQPLLENHLTKIDLTSPNHEYGECIVAKSNGSNMTNDKDECMDLTQSSHSDDSLPFVQISGRSQLQDDTIIINHEEIDRLKDPSTTENASISSCDKSSVLSLDEMENIEILNDSSTTKKQTNHEKSKTESFFEEYVYQHSNSSNKVLSEIEILDLDESHIVSVNKSNNDKNIDLTQTSNSSDNTHSNWKPKSSLTYETTSLGKNNDVSIDYDEIFDNIVENHTSNSKHSSISSISIVYDMIEDNNDKPCTEKLTKNSNSVRSSSQNSVVFEISDKELDYSLHRSKHDYFEIGGLSIMDNLSVARNSKSISSCDNNHDINFKDSINEGFLPKVDLKSTQRDIDDEQVSSQNNTYNSEVDKPEVFTNEAKISVATPSNSEYIIRTNEVTPMIDFALLTTPERNKELDKYGLKPFKRKRAIKLLTYLYNQTHPLVEACSSDSSPSKKLKTKHDSQTCVSPRKLLKSPKHSEDTTSNKQSQTSEQVQSGEGTDKNIFRITSEVPNIKDIECGEDDWVFQKREKAKLHSCRIPLHIAFHNYVHSRGDLRDAILRYEPIDIDVVHKELVANGQRYDPKDLLKFMDKKCITVKTTDNSTRIKRN